MGLSSILSTATTGLQAVQTQLQWRTDNINNTNSTTYGRRDPATLSTTNHGLTVTFTRAGDAGLQKQVLDATAKSSAATATADYETQIGDILGTTQTTSTLETDMANFTSAWQGLETDSASSSAEADVVSSGQTVAQDITSSYQQLTAIGEQVSADVGSSISTLNTKLTALAAINKQLSADPATATNDPSLLDQRDSLLADISGTVGVNVVSHSDGSVALYSKTGTVLVDKEAAQFQWTQPTAAGSQGYITLAGTTGTAPGLNAGFSGGKIGAALNVLDPSTTSTNADVGTLAKAQAQLDAYALQLTGQASGSFGGAYYSATSDRSTDLAGGSATLPVIYSSYGLTSAATTATATAAGWNGTALTSFFTIDNGSTTGPTAPSQSPAASLAVNAALVDGTATVKRQSATAVVAALTATTRSLTAGGVNVANKSLAGLASAIADYQATSQSAASTAKTSLAQTASTLQTRLSSEIGVNSDTEMAQLTILENAYSANAKVISTVQSMFDTLMNLKSSS